MSGQIRQRRRRTSNDEKASCRCRRRCRRRRCRPACQAHDRRTVGKIGSLSAPARPVLQGPPRGRGETVDARDLKSLGGDPVRVQVPPSALGLEDDSSKLLSNHKATPRKYDKGEKRGSTVAVAFPKAIRKRREFAYSSCRLALPGLRNGPGAACCSTTAPFADLPRAVPEARVRRAGLALGGLPYLRRRKLHTQWGNSGEFAKV